MFYALFNKPRAYPAGFAPYWKRLNFYDGRAAWLASTQGVPKPALHLYCVHWQYEEVFNGGFWQYFFNSTGVTAPEAVEGWQAIGMPEVARITATAATRLGDPYPTDKQARRQIVGYPEERLEFNEADTAFYDLTSDDRFFRRDPKFVAFADRYARANGLI